jgi:hypothetical protein
VYLWNTIPDLLIKDYFDRHIKLNAISFLNKCSFLAITVPQQSGKITFARRLKPDNTYVNLELQEAQNFTKADPLAFLRPY